MCVLYFVSPSLIKGKAKTQICLQENDEMFCFFSP